MTKYTFAVLLASMLLCSASGARVLKQASDGNITDADILNFALNLEYLEAEYYLCAVNGTGVPEELRGGGPPSIGCEQAQLSPQGQEYADETALDELRHVAFLRAALGDKAVPMPLVDVGPAFETAASAALGNASGAPFSPYVNDITFYLGGFLFEDVGVTAYRGAIPLLQSVDNQFVAAGLLGTEAYHAGSIRTLLGQFRQVPSVLGPNVLDVVEAFSDVRDAVDGPDDLDQGIELDGALNILPTDEDSIVYSRDVDQVLAIVYLGNAATPGGFFPDGLNGVLA